MEEDEGAATDEVDLMALVRTTIDLVGFRNNDLAEAQATGNSDQLQQVLLNLIEVPTAAAI